MDNLFNITLGDNSTDTCHSYLGNDFPWFERYPIILGCGLAGGVLLPILVPIVLCVLGFTCWGIMAGSAAACCQSSIGNVPAGSCFACCQSAGAGGCPCCCVFIMVVLAFVGAGLGGYLTFLDTQPCDQRTGYLTLIQEISTEHNNTFVTNYTSGNSSAALADNMKYLIV